MESIYGARFWNYKLLLVIMNDNNNTHYTDMLHFFIVGCCTFAEVIAKLKSGYRFLDHIM